MVRICLFSLLLLVQLASLAQTVGVEFYTPRIVRITKEAPGAQVCGTSAVITAQPQTGMSIRTQQTDGITTYRSGQLTVTVDEATGRVTFRDGEGRLLMQEGEGSLTPITLGVDQGLYRARQAFRLAADEELYGVGMLQNGKLSQRGEDRLMMQSNLEDYANVFQSIRGWGLYWDNYSPTQFTTPQRGEAGDMVLESQVAQQTDYYFMWGGDADGVIAQMRHLSGHAPMIPLWTYGFHQSRERYKTQDELLQVLRHYRRDSIPLDGIIQDWQYWGSNYTWNAMDFLHEDYQGAQRMIDEVHQRQAHMSISIWASFGPQTHQYRELQEQGLLFGFETWPQSALPMWPPHMDYPSGVRVYNPYRQEARDTYWRYLSHLNDMGIDAWWMDSTDPDHHSYRDSDLDEACLVDAPLQQHTDSQRVSYRSVRNLFPLATVQGVYDHQRQVDSTKRVFILTRSYFAGQQRTGAATWSGDIGSSWQAMRAQLPLCLNHTLTANPQVNFDLGGFFAGSYNVSGHNSAIRNPQYQELYARWMQFGAFVPMMRSHGTDVYRELYLYGQPGQPVYDALVGAVRLRYRFLPYIYSQAWQVTSRDDSFMRALFMDFHDDPRTWDCTTQYLFGHHVLVCPVLRPLYTQERIVRTDAMSGWDTTPTSDGETSTPGDWTAPRLYPVYLPAGAQWYDYWTDQLLDGGQDIQASVTLQHSPLYIRAGSILPLGPDVQYANENRWDHLTLAVYPGQDASFTLYEDEGDTYRYEQGEYSTIQLTWNERNRTLTLGKRQGSFRGMPLQRTFIVRLAGGGERTITYTGRQMRVKL